MPRAEADSLFALADACVACGLCLPHCPTYADARQEAESPRGRIMVARAVAAGKLDLAEAAAGEAIEHCLGCRACEAACPAQVAYGELLPALRGALRKARPAPWRQRVVEAVLARPGRLRLARAVARLLRRLPGMARRIPALPAARPLRPLPPTAARRGRVLLLPGCVGSALDAPAHAVALRLLAGMGWEVVGGAAHACCGSLHRHAGAGDAAAPLQARLAAAISAAAPDHVLIASSGCVESVQAAAGARPVHELCDFLDRSPGWEALPLRVGNRRVGVQVACTQRNVLRRPAAAANLLQRVPGLHLVEAPASGCCGAAGMQRLRYPDQAARRVAPLRDWARTTQLDVVCASNVGCRLHLQLALADAAGPPVCHPLEVIGEHLP
jgi:glycolate oxidase iron-sulfur subunit